MKKMLLIMTLCLLPALAYAGGGFYFYASSVTLEGTLEMVTPEANVASGGASSASSEGGDGNAAIFDNNLSTYWQFDSMESLPQWFKYQLPMAKQVIRYEIYQGPGSLTDWTFEGSNDDSNWDVLDTQFGQPSTSPINKTVASPGTYLYYRINFSATEGGGAPWIYEMYLYGAGTSSSLSPSSLALGGGVTANSFTVTGGTHTLHYCDDGASVNTICRGNTCSCSGGTWQSMGILVP